jgi:stearoyl-CoA desaturase (Delta-9 desaturase)
MPVPTDAQGGARSRADRTVIVDPYLHRLQRRHFLLFDVLPLLGTIAALGLIPVRPPDRWDIATFATLWLLTGMGISVGYHRLFAHRAFATTPAIGAALAILGSMAARGPLISWVAIHRRHHQHSDRAGDVHSPNLHDASPGARVRAWLHAHLTWMIRHAYPNPGHYARDLLSDKMLARINRKYRLWIAVGLVVPTAIGGMLGGGPTGALEGLLWGGAVRIFAVEHSMSAINSCLHLCGARPYATPDNSRNSFWLGVLAWGEGWHNNHHAFPYSAAFGQRWYQVDPGYWLIRCLQALGLARDVRLARERPVATQNG